MATYIPYAPTTVIGSAMFNFDAFGVSNYKLDGTVRVSVSDSFTSADLAGSSYSNFYSQLYTSASAEVTWSAQMTANIQDVLAIYSQFAGIPFQWVGDNDTFPSGTDTTPNPEDVGRANLSDINVNWIYRSDGSFAGISGSSSDSLFLRYTGAAGDIFLSSYVFAGDMTLDLNTRARQTLMHELGHSLGLSHPHSAYNSLSGVPTITADYAVTKDLGFGQLGFHITSAADMYKEYFTIMSYDDQQSLLPGSTTLFHAHTPTILDVIALQQAYGEGSGTSGSGNDVIAAGNAGYRTYFDKGGIDTIDLSIYADSAYLHMGASIVGAAHLVGVAMSLHDAQVTIIDGGNPANLRWFYGEYENAIGGSNNDLMIGNRLENIIRGEAGNDTLDGGAGSDTLDGGAGDDTFLFGRGSGADVITLDADDSGTDALQLGTGIAVGDVRLVTSGNNLWVSIRGTSDNAFLPGYLNSTGDRSVETIRFNSGTTWDFAFIGAHMEANVAPVITAPAVRNTERGVWNQFSSFISVSDADGDPMVSFEVKDATSTAGSGILYANGMVQAQGASVTVNASDLTGIYVQGGVNIGHDTLEIRAFDGIEWSGWTTIDLNTRLPNRAPVVTPSAATQGVPIGSSVAASSLFTVSDADGDAMTQYHFYDTGSGGGRFTVNGTTQGALTVITVDAASLANTRYASGNTQGSELLYVQVYDGTVWSEWTSWTEQSQRTTNVGAPVINGPAAKNSDVSQWQQLSGFLSTSDADGDLPVRFTITDNNSTAGSGLLYANGAIQGQGVTVTVNASNLAGVWVQGGSTTGTNRFTLTADDGFVNGVGPAKTLDLVTRLPNRAPVVSPSAATQGVPIGSSVAASSLFTVSDADGDAMTQYHFYDTGVGGGRFTVNGTTQGALTVITVDAANLANTRYVSGAAQGSETLYVQVYDGTVWSEWTSWTEQSQRTTNVGAPVINGPAAKNTEVSQWNQLSTFLTVTDADGDAPVRFTITDNGATAGSGRLYANGLIQPQGVTVTVNASNLSGVWVQGGTSIGTNRFTLTADDGFVNGVGPAKTLDLVTRLPNRAPVVTPSAATQGVPIGSSVAASSLFTVSDADGDAMTQYHFYDTGSGGGRFTVNGATQAAVTVITVDAANLANTRYASGNTQGSELLYVQVYDGTVWSEWTSWTEQSQRTTNVGAPVINGPAAKNSDVSQWQQLSGFLSTSDADGDLPVRFTITDNNSTAGSGLLYANGAIQAQGVTVTVNASNLAGVWVQGGSTTGTNRFTLTADDGFVNGVGPAKTLDLVTRLPNRAPVVTTQAFATAPEQAIAVTRLFTVSDADGDAMTQYHFYDAGSGGGFFRVNGVAQPAVTILTVNASDLANTYYVGGIGDGAEALWMQANDGSVWSEWQGWQMTTGQLARFPEVLGTRNADTFDAFQSSVYFGLGGNDRFNSQPNAGPFFVGGTGGDTYVGGALTGFSFVLETGDSAGDVLAYSDFIFNHVNSGTGIVDGRHLLLAHVNPFTEAFAAIVVFDWENPANRIETFNVGSGGYSYDQFRSQVFASAPEIFSFADLGLSEVSGILNEEIAYYASRSLELDVNPAPVVSASGAVLAESHTVAVSQLFSASDPNGDTITSYEFTDMGSGGGVLLVGGVAQAVGAPVVVQSSQLATATYATGGVTDTDVLRIRAFDGTDWSAPLDRVIAPVHNSAPVVTGENFISTPGRLLYASEFFSASDPDGHTITAIDLRSPAGFNPFGTANGFDSGNPITAHIVSFDSYGFSVGAPDGTYQLSARAFDGVDWSDWKDINFTVATPADAAGNDFGSARTVNISSSTQIFNDWVGAADIVDYYRITVNGSESVIVGTGQADYGQGLQVRLLNAANQNAMPIMSVSYVNGASYTTQSLEAGDYFVGVSANGSSSYGLSLSTQAGTPFDGAGNTFATARMVTLSSTPQTFHDWLGTEQPAPDTVDYYRFTATGPETVHVQLSGNTQQFNLTPFSLQADGSNNGTIPGGGTISAGGQSMNISIASAGNYALQLVGTSNPGSYYDITLSSP